MWKFSNWKKPVKIILTIFLAFLSFVILATNSKSKPQEEEIITTRYNHFNTIHEEASSKYTSTYKSTTETSTEIETVENISSQDDYNYEEDYNHEEDAKYDDYDYPSYGKEYVLNTNTKKIHKSTCSSAQKISANNYATTDDYDGAIADGYEPCKRCNP
jgi:hypothetical protein